SRLVVLALFAGFPNASDKNLLMVDIRDNYTALPARLGTLLATVDDAYLYFCDFYLPVFSSLYLLTLSEYETALLSHRARGMPRPSPPSSGTKPVAPKSVPNSMPTTPNSTA
ncbi:MAG: hypothetical protein WCO45_16205, partial [Pseudanabaena sp. ELA607]